MLPLIGITGRRVRAAEAFPADSAMLGELRIDAHFSSYSEKIAAAGGLPVQLAPDGDPAAVVERLDGLVLSGGPDVAPERYGGAANGWRPTDPTRDSYELALLDAAFARDIPVLGVCRGAQLLNVARGGTLRFVDHPPDAPHFSNERPMAELVHRVAFSPGTTAYAVFGQSCEVNSSHSQAVDRPGRDVIVSGVGDDGTIETIEISGRRTLGVQWHAEWHEALDPVFGWLVEEARVARAPASRHTASA